MKANINNNINLEGKDIFGRYELQLTVGMIVKNEEKTLERCLQSMQPLLNAIPSELIITDTGSTDNTVTIAKKYTEHIIPFEWCDDFAAARNSGLKLARGQWFMFIDGDEWFENCAELIEFFKSGECNNYASGSYIQRNYNNLEGNSYNDFHASRIFRRYPGMHFVGIIHENIPRIDPCKFLNSYVHHYGYAHKTKQSLQNKFYRNSNLLIQEIEENTENLKAYFQLTQEYMTVQNYGKAIQTAKIGLEKAIILNAKNWRNTILHHLIRSQYLSNDYKSVLEFCDQYINSDEIPFLDCYYLEVMAAFKLKNYKEAINCGKKYLNLYRLYKSDKLDKSLLMLSCYDFINDEDHDEVIRQMARGYILLNDKENTVYYLNQINLTLPDSITKTFSVYSFAQEEFEVPLLSKLFKNILALNDEERYNVFIVCLEGYLETHRDDSINILRTIFDYNLQDKYSLLCNLRISEAEGNQEDSLNFLNKLTDFPDLDIYFSDVLYYAIKDGLSLKSYLPLFDTDDFFTIISYIQNQHDDFNYLIEEYLKIVSPETNRDLLWIIRLLERVIVKNAKEKNTDECFSLLEQYADFSGEYLSALYRDDILEENIALLPRVNRFMYWLNKAFEAKREADNVCYLGCLRTALNAYPVMNSSIQLLLEQFEAEQQQQKANNSEFTALAAKMKVQVKTLIGQGRLQEAGQIISQLIPLLPNDLELKELHKLTFEKPQVSEMISDLPQ